MPTVRKVTSKIKKVAPVAPAAEVAVPVVEVEAGDDKTAQVRTKKYCQFCSSKTEPAYWEITSLRRFINDRGRIVLRARTGTCSKHQRRVAIEIKHARHLAMLPFTVQV